MRQALFCYKPLFAATKLPFTETNKAFTETKEYQWALRVYLPQYYI
jgi:hypothetical protein